MSDYEAFSKEYESLQSIINNQLNDIIFLSDNFNSFKKGIILIENNLKSIKGNSEEYNFINTLFDDYIKEIHEFSKSFNEKITLPIQQFIQSFNFTTNHDIKEFYQIKNSLIDNKKKIKKVKEDYYCYIKSNKNLENEKDDNKELLKAKKDNLAQLYKYEIDKANEIITKNNIKYFDIYNNLDNLNLNTLSIIKDTLNKFIENLADIGNIFIKFSEQFKKSLNSNFEIIENNKRYIPTIDKKTNMRFNYEIFEEYDENNNSINIIEDNSNNTINNKFGAFTLKRSNVISKEDYEDFEVINDMDTNTKRIKKEIDKLDSFIKKFPGTIELTASEISELMNILKTELLVEGQTFSFIFLNNLKTFFKNRVINFKNKKNFIHLSNIMNNICIKEDNTKTFNAIIQVSQMIKYENSFLFSAIQRKNRFFSTKTFWLRIIHDNLINNINKYVDEIISQNLITDKKTLKEKIKEMTKKKGKLFESKEKSNIFINNGLDKEIHNFNNLNEEQMKSLEKFAYENICIILSESIPGMCSFLVPEFISIDIIKQYAKLFNFTEKTISYFFNILETRNNGNSLSEKETKENSTKKYIHNNIIFIISSTLKYISKKDFINLICLNKEFSPQIKNKIFKFLLSNEKLNIENRIKLWGIILKIKEAKETVNYQEIKNIMKEKLETKTLDQKTEEKNIYTINVDLNRTPFINTNQTHIEKVGWILKCLNLLRTDIGYCQGMNFLALFFYQLLDYDEEKAFYYLFALETETKYRDIFIEDMKLLNEYYTVLDKIINLYNPELYYKFVDSNIVTNFYSTSWFITLFTDINCVFQKNNAPKYILMVLENFILDGFSAIFTSGYTIIRYQLKQILELETEKLIPFMIKDLCENDIFKNENFNKIKKYYERNSEKINKALIKILSKIVNYENENPYLKKVKI